MVWYVYVCVRGAVYSVCVVCIRLKGLSWASKKLDKHKFEAGTLCFLRARKLTQRCGTESQEKQEECGGAWTQKTGRIWGPASSPLYRIHVLTANLYVFSHTDV